MVENDPVSVKTKCNAIYEYGIILCEESWRARVGAIVCVFVSTIQVRVTYSTTMIA